MDIGSRIRYFRKNAHLTQEELAKKANISRSYLADVEKNRYNPSLDTLDKLINALEITKTDFYNDGTTVINVPKESEDEFLNKLNNENKTLYKKIKSLSPADAKKILDIITIFEKENQQ